MSNLYREPSIDVSYQVSVHLAKRFQRKQLLEIDKPGTRIAYDGHVCLTDRDKMSKLDRGPSIDASYHVTVHLAKQFQRRFFRKSTNQKQVLPMVAMFVHRSGRNEQTEQRTFHRCFIPCFSSLGQAVSEEKIQIEKLTR
jgi:hypothetical protein